VPETAQPQVLLIEQRSGEHEEIPCIPFVGGRLPRKNLRFGKKVEGSLNCFVRGMTQTALAKLPGTTVTLEARLYLKTYEDGERFYFINLFPAGTMVPTHELQCVADRHVSSGALVYDAYPPLCGKVVFAPLRRLGDMARYTLKK
jgi:hypothetical protein